ncbi:unnamed protein product [Strongylus vulgaris]|uniref:Uncharacterized protein n=1 Tax=Strongylus vulgaris TaxID=40348 RepID=A0A3P7KIA2_STRVU|nr:unnamed protein product [Strongylus vulgaris]
MSQVRTERQLKALQIDDIRITDAVTEAVERQPSWALLHQMIWCWSEEKELRKGTEVKEPFQVVRLEAPQKIE